MIDLTFEKLYRYDRLAEPCHAAIPLKRGELTDIGDIAVFQKGMEVASQAKVTSYYPDGSIRYLFLRFEADLPGNDGTVLQCDLKSKKKRKIEGIRWIKREDEIEVDCNTLKFRVKNHSNHLFHEFFDGKRFYDASQWQGPYLTDGEGSIYGVLFDQWEIKEEGPVCIILKTSGECVGSKKIKFEMQITAYHNKPWVEIAYTIINTTLEPLKVESLTFSLKVNDKNIILDNSKLFDRNVTKDEIKLVTNEESNKNTNDNVSDDTKEELSKNTNDGLSEDTKDELKKDIKGFVENTKDKVNVKQMAKVRQSLTFSADNYVESTKENINNSNELEQSTKDKKIYQTVGTSDLEQIETQNPVSTIRTCVATSNYKTRFQIAFNGTKLGKVIDEQYIIAEGFEHFAEVFFGTFFADRTDEVSGVCATVFQAYQNYPKAVEADEDGIRIMLVPEQTGNIALESGMAREQKFQLHFHTPEEALLEINNRSIIYQMPDRPIVAASVFEKAAVMPDIFVKNTKDDVEAVLIAKGDSHARCFGMLNWGDAPDPGYTAQGRGHGKPVWTNNEYDYPHACALQYAKTGLRRFLDYAIVAGSHWKDVDVCHFSPDPLIHGGQWEHTHNHVKEGSIVCSHEWVEGLLDCYHFTGDDAYLKTALGIGENVLRLLETPMYQKSGEVGARETGWALRTLVALYTETADLKWVEKSKWIIGQFKEWKETYGHWLSTYMDNVLIRVPFMISVAVGSLMRYYREFPEPEVKQMMLEAIDDVVSHSLFQNGMFYYKEIPSLNRLGNNPLVLELLTIGYQLTGDVSYLKHGKKTFEFNLQDAFDYIIFNKRVVEDAVITGVRGTKEFAQSFLPMAVYYKAASDHHLL